MKRASSADTEISIFSIVSVAIVLFLARIVPSPILNRLTPKSVRQFFVLPFGEEPNLQGNRPTPSNLCGESEGEIFTMGKIPIALQLYSVREDAAKDLAHVLDVVAKSGYDGVEFAGYYGHDAPTLKKMLDDRGLKCAGAHVGLDTLLGDELEKSVAFHKILDNPYLIVPGLGENRRNSADALNDTIGIFNEVAAKLKPHGQYTGYHNHAVEFVPMGENGELMWDLFFGGTSPDVIMQFDTGNALHGGADALPYLEGYPGRAVTVHLKEYSATNDKALIGEGDVPFQRIFDVCESTGGTKWYIVEQESYAYPPLECAERCIKILRDWGK